MYFNFVLYGTDHSYVEDGEPLTLRVNFPHELKCSQISANKKRAHTYGVSIGVAAAAGIGCGALAGGVITGAIGIDVGGVAVGGDSTGTGVMGTEPTLTLDIGTLELRVEVGDVTLAGMGTDGET